MFVRNRIIAWKQEEDDEKEGAGGEGGGILRLSFK